MKLGIGVVKEKMFDFVNFFKFSDYEMTELNTLMAGFGDDELTKKNTNIYAVL